jgi:hypothetical protein
MLILVHLKRQVQKIEALCGNRNSVVPLGKIIQEIVNWFAAPTLGISRTFGSKKTKTQVGVESQQHRLVGNRQDMCIA